MKNFCVGLPPLRDLSWKSIYTARHRLVLRIDERKRYHIQDNHDVLHSQSFVAYSIDYCVFCNRQYIPHCTQHIFQQGNILPTFLLKCPGLRLSRYPCVALPEKMLGIFHIHRKRASRRVGGWGIENQPY